MNRNRWILVWVFAILPLLGWWAYGLFDLDEGFYGAVVAEMNRRGEWITPYYNGQPWFEKPILLYWVAKPCLALFGTLVGPRVPGVLATLGVYGITAWFCRRRFSDEVAQMAVSILAGSLLVVAVGRMMMTDSPLLLCLTAAFLTFWESLVGSPRWRILTGILLGLGVLAKGPVALILFGVVMAWTYWREKELRPNFRGSWPLSWALLILVVCTWYVPAYLENGHLFVQKFLIEQNLNRFTGGDAAHTLGGIGSLILYIPILFLGMLPWSLWTWKALAKTEGALERYLAAAAIFIFLFFSISGAKLPHYILPVIPPLAILVAIRVHSDKARNWALAVCAVVAIVVQAGFMFYYEASAQNELHEWAYYVDQVAPRDRVAMYRMSRLDGDLGTGKLKIMETSKPSVVMILNRDVLDASSFDELLSSPTPLWIITRSNRIGPEDYVRALQAGKVLTQVHGTIPESSYKLFRLDAR